MNNQVYVITDVEAYADSMRQIAANAISESRDISENLDIYINLNEVIRIIYDNSESFDIENRPLIAEKNAEKIYKDILNWIYDISLAKLASADKIECAWENGNMVFWMPKKHNQEVSDHENGKNS